MGVLNGNIDLLSRLFWSLKVCIIKVYYISFNIYNCLFKIVE